MHGSGEPMAMDAVDRRTDAYRIGYSTDLEAVVAEWRHCDDPAAYREGVELLLDRIEAHGARKHLSDARAVVPPQDSLVQWVIDECVPRLAETTVEYEAVVYPVDSAARFFADQVGRAQTDVDVEQLFAEDMETAMAWLRMR